MARATARLSTVTVLLTLVVLALGPARSDEGGDLSLDKISGGALDGLSFEGIFGSPTGSSEQEDVLYFNDGQFWSKICVPCGFAPGPYRATRTHEGIRFEGVLESPDRGRFHYTGVVKDGRLVAQINWRKERWYWTIDKDFRFEGARADGSAAVSAMSVTRLALAAKPEPDACRP